MISVHKLFYYSHLFSNISWTEESIDKLGQFGKSHFDMFNGRAYLSSFDRVSMLQPEGEGGQFHSLEFGIFACLNSVTFMNFSGLQYHTGTPSLCPVRKHP
jgi:hypothetical protein